MSVELMFISISKEMVAKFRASVYAGSVSDLIDVGHAFMAHNIYDLLGITGSIPAGVEMKEQNIEPVNLSVYPNPSNGSFTILNEHDDFDLLYIYNSNGLLISTQKLRSSNQEFAFGADLPKGEKAYHQDLNLLLLLRILNSNMVHAVNQLFEYRFCDIDFSKGKWRKLQLTIIYLAINNAINHTANGFLVFLF